MRLFYNSLRTIEGFPNDEMDHTRDSVDYRDQLWRWNGVLTPHPYELHPIIPDKCFLFGLGVSHSISRMSDATPPHKRVMAILFLTIVTK